MIRFQARLSQPSSLSGSKHTDYLSREYYLKVGTQSRDGLRNLRQALPRTEKWSIIHFREEHAPSLVSPSFQVHRRLYCDRCIRRILSLPLNPKHFLSTLEKLQVTHLISYLSESRVWTLVLLSGRS